MARRLVTDHSGEKDLIGIWVYTFKQWNEA